MAWMDPIMQTLRNSLFHALCLVILIHSSHSAPLSSYLVSSFSSPNPRLPFRFMAVDNTTGDVYIGAEEEIYHLGSDFRLKETVEVGSCNIQGSQYLGEQDKNRLLVIAPAPTERLITCGRCDGYCEMRKLSNITDAEIFYESTTQIVVKREDVSMVGVVVAGGNSNTSQYLYTGISNSVWGELPVSKFDLTSLVHFQSIATSRTQHENNEYNQVMLSTPFIYYVIQLAAVTRYSALPVIGRLCIHTNDHNLESYTQIQLECKDRTGSNYNVIQAAHISPAGSKLADSLSISSTDDVMYAVFTKENSSPVQSALCLYKMSDIQQRFTEAVVDCITCSGTSDCSGKSVDYLGHSSCGVAPHSAHPESRQCQATDNGLPYYAYANGVNPVTASPVLILSDVKTTSIITTKERDYTAAFIGNSDGNLVKVHILNGSSAYQYETIPLGQGSVLRDVFLDEHEEQIILGTGSSRGSKVSKLFLANCSNFKSCEECIGPLGEHDGDPYCGWCTLEGRCTRFNECPHGREESTRWLPYDAAPCSLISEIQPSDKIIYDQPEQSINIVVEQLPELFNGNQYICVFDLHEVSAVTNGNTISCVTPPASVLPQIPDRDDHIVMSLAIKSTETGVLFATRDLFFFDCSLSVSCSSCVTRPWPCDWCVYENRCTRGSSTCFGDSTVLGTNNPVRMGNRGQEYCPQLLGVHEEILLPVGVNTAYTLLAKHLPTDQRTVRFYECIIDVEGAEQTVRATQYTESRVGCDGAYTYKEEILSKSVRVSVRWNGNNNIDDATDSRVTLYKCSVNSESCSRCLSPEVTPARLGCGWCGNDCNVVESDVCHAEFLNQNMYLQCNGPVITSIFPASGPPEGNTRLEIRGKDLGLTFSHITKISVGNSDCDLKNMDVFYEPGLSVSCMTSPHDRISAEKIQIVVTLSDGDRTAYFEDPFYFRDPRVTRFNPKKGPAAGGTRITVYGDFLDTGRNITARLGNSECIDVTYDGSEASCTTTAVAEGAQSFIMMFDGADRFSPDAFNVLPNPVVTSVDRSETILSGGLQMRLTGERFDIIQESRIISHSLSSGANRAEVCVNVSPTLLICPTPPYPDGQSQGRRARQSDAWAANITFDLDGFVISGGIITYHPNPIYFDISESDRIAIITDNMRLDLEGEYLDTASNTEDIQVLIGPDGVCDVQILEFDTLICFVPIPLPGAGDYNGSRGEGSTNSLPAVVVRHGNLEFRPGFVQAHSESNILPVVISMVVIAVLVLLTVAVVFGWRLTKKRQEANQVREELELERRRLRSRIKEVPDTKLELTDVDERVKKHGIPFRDDNQYVTVMLFSGLGLRPETSDPEYMEDFMEQTIVSFYRSLKDEESVVAFIKTLEVNRQHEQNTRELIAALLSLIYLSEGKSIYFSKLISRLVRDRVAVTASSSGKLNDLFGRSESIVDKLLADWFALCMCGYIKQQMLYPMFMLYQALKSQSEKGPIDAITGEAYFTLDYNRLFDQDITFQEVVLFVVDEDDNALLIVKVLDADSVGQAKQKILDSIWKAGQRLLPTNGDALDVVWLRDAGTNLILRDADEGTNDHVSGRLNTVKTYGLEHGCRVTVRPKEAEADSSGYQQLVPSSLLSNKYESLMVNRPSTTRGPSTPKPSNLRGTHLKGSVQPEIEDTTTPVNIIQGRTGLGRDLAVAHMLTTKAAVSPYVRNVLESMFKFPMKYPLPIKHLFDTFDELAREYSVGADTDVAERWKRNCLTQFWVELLASVPSLFDMPRSDPADQCLNVLVDAIFHATKDEPPPQTSKHQPYFGDYSLQSRMVATFCNEMAGLPKVCQTKLFSACATITKEFRGNFSHQASLLQLFKLTKHDLQDMLQ